MLDNNNYLLYDVFMHLDIIPNRKSHPCCLIRESYRENGKVKHRTLANVSHLPFGRIMALKRVLQGDFDEALMGGDNQFKTLQGPKFGALYALCRIAEEEGILDVLGKDRMGKLALLLVVGQILCSNSRLALVEWAKDQAVYDVLGLGSVDGPDYEKTISITSWIISVKNAIVLRRNSLRKGLNNAIPFSCMT